MAKLIEVEVDGASARFELREDLAPQTAAALWEVLPIEGPLRHGKLSGDACFIHDTSEPLASLPERPELPLSSIYKGWLVVVPAPSRGMAEILISYGLAEYRWPTGRRHATPVAEVQGDATALFDMLKRTHAEGEKQVAIRRV